ncbi:DEAD/DEAH box helicase [Zavarzinia aquatilis]|uniref:ATP-dependent helicase n=1 Tax=Zavarzinia aquatilis TaxID=2211142 RepID=A0A317DU50_9PROT|nr:DEAD/DEAH box helicase [Zavarzinia aquatilis]PWR17912.1 ATP-dependent helicase [Zavarzinia aquatilis]
MRRLTPFQVVEEIRQRSVEAILGLSGLNHPALAKEIRRKFGGRDIGAGALLQEPIVEAAFPFIEAEETLASLAGTTIHSKVVDALDQPGDPRIGRDWHPYKHQLEAWRYLTDPKPQSILVTSGTGSGKTECFMVPLLDDLAREAEGQSGPLSGVRAIALYPLNALIANQQDRLGKWTRPFKGKIRYALYNGEMPDDDKAGRERQVPEQILCRRTLRADPPPILVTNVTMLEYLTVRRKDRPILDASQGRLRWIILDEAHSYTGSNAAEIALLLRRVLLSFGVTPAQVRFVATSATIGEGADVTEELRRFLRDVSGAPAEHVHVVVGHRHMPDLPPVDREKSLADISWSGRDARSTDDRLARNPLVQKQIAELTKGARDWPSVARDLAETELEPEALALALARTEIAGHRLLPLRFHVFHRAIPGLWTCLDPSCAGRADGWPFGALLPEAVDQCPECGGRVLPVVSCRNCGEPFLDAVEDNRILRSRDDGEREDEYARDSEEEGAASSDDDGTGPSAPGIDRLIAVRRLRHGRPMNVDPRSGAVADQPGEGLVALSAHDREDPEYCPACAGAGTRRRPQILRPFRFGAPTILTNASPLLLEGADISVSGPPSGYGSPAEGRQLLSFTDSRQGTARLSAKLQNAAERNRIRALIYFAVQDSLRVDPAVADDLARVNAAITELRRLGGAAAEAAVPFLEQQQRALTKSNAGLPWEVVRSRLSEQHDVSHWMLQVWAKRDPDRFGDPVKGRERFAELLLLRELARRTKQANSVETMGLAKLRFAAIENLPEGRTPNALRTRGKAIQDWRDFLYLCLTIAARDYFAIRIGGNDAHWLQPGIPPKRLIGPKSAITAKTEIRWPQIRPDHIGNRGSLPRLLEVGLGLDAEERGDRETINELLEKAWFDLGPLFTAVGSGADMRLELGDAVIAPVEDAWRCPVTRRVLDTTFCGYSPYGLTTGLTRGSGALAEPIKMPRHPAPFMTSPGDEELVRRWLADDEGVRKLRVTGLWGNLHDRIALGSPYARAAEHSAQQPSQRLRNYEAEFRCGEINILNCSTTMEMGVDIGSVSTVMMTNVPPSIANYRQRVGRAGRRRQATAMAFTYCRDNPIEWEAFREPLRFLGRAVAAPRVSLDSAPLVQRHANALLLAAFVRGQNGDATTTKAGAFYGFPADLRKERLPDPPSVAFRAWLAKPSVREAMAGAMGELLRGSVLENDKGIFESAKSAVETAEGEFRAEWDGLQSQAVGLDREIARKAIGFQLQRLCGEFLLSDLSDRGVLPGHGFPTAVVQFIHKDEPDRDEGAAEEGSPFRRRFFASRNLDQAMRDYAPGADVVIDGLVYRSAGVTLNWKRPAGDKDARDIQSLGFVWHCKQCGAAGTHRVRVSECSECGAAGDPLWQAEYLRPAGFAAEPRPAHSDADIVAYVPPEAPIVAARGSAWHPLRVPELGRSRSSANGLVFYSSAGGGLGDGYTVCLHCGRAQAMDAPENLPFASHRPLRYTKADDDGKCPGASRPFAVKQNILFGHEIRTDVFELQLDGLDQPGAAWAFGSALRTVLTRELGVELNEVGLWIERRSTAIGGWVHSIFLFDHASGGAGFSPRAQDLFAKLLGPIRGLLDCGVEGCINGCSACVLTPDLHEQQKIIDRQSALAFVETRMGALATPAPVDHFVSGASFSDNLVDELAAGAGSVTIWGEHPNVAALRSGPFSRLAASLQHAGRPLVLVLTREILAGMDDAMRLALRDLAARFDIVLRSGSAPRFPNGAVALAALGASGSREIWATRDSGAGILGDAWGVAAEAPILRATWHLEDNVEAVPADLMEPRADAAFISFTTECNGPLSGFGARLLECAKPLLQRVGGWRAGHLVGVEYFDRYLKNPLTVRLACEFIGALSKSVGKAGQVQVSLVSEPWRPDPRYDDRRPWQAVHDWRSDDDRVKTTEAVLGRFGMNGSMVLRRDRHAREMVLSFDDSTAVTIVFDQGFGCWAGPRGIPLRFDFGASAQDQAQKLAALNAMIEGPDSPSYIVVHR